MPLQTNCLRPVCYTIPQQAQETSQLQMWSDLLSAGWLPALPSIKASPALILRPGDRECSCFQSTPTSCFQGWCHFPARNIIPSTRWGEDFMWDSSALYLLGFADQKHELYLLLFVYTSKCYSTVYTNIFLNPDSCKATTWVIFRLLGTAAVQK